MQAVQNKERKMKRPGTVKVINDTVVIKFNFDVGNVKGERMNFNDCKEKYFILVEGEERAIIRDTEEAAEKKRKKLSKYCKGKRIFVFKAEKRNI